MHDTKWEKIYIKKVWKRGRESESKSTAARPDTYVAEKQWNIYANYFLHTYLTPFLLSAVNFHYKFVQNALRVDINHAMTTAGDLQRSCRTTSLVCLYIICFNETWKLIFWHFWRGLIKTIYVYECLGFYREKESHVAGSIITTSYRRIALFFKHIAEY